MELGGGAAILQSKPSNSIGQLGCCRDYCDFFHLNKRWMVIMEKQTSTWLGSSD